MFLLHLHLHWMFAAVTWWFTISGVQSYMHSWLVSVQCFINYYVPFTCTVESLSVSSMMKKASDALHTLSKCKEGSFPWNFETVATASHSLKFIRLNSRLLGWPQWRHDCWTFWNQHLLMGSSSKVLVTGHFRNKNTIILSVLWHLLLSEV